MYWWNHIDRSRPRKSLLVSLYNKITSNLNNLDIEISTTITIRCA